jgi:acetolactate synthase-1/2/3 large subunit
VAQWRQRFGEAKPTDPPEPVVEGGTPAAFFAALRAALPRDAILVTDSGLHQVLTRRHYDVLSPRGLLYPSDFQSMGFGLPAAIGAKLAEPTRAVVVVMGDGGLAMTGLELLTAAREKLPVVVVVFNDGQLNLIRLQQLKEFGRASGVELLVPDLEQFAQSVGAQYRAATNDFATTMAEALSHNGPTLIEVAVGDSRSIAGVRAKSLARETVRKIVGPGVVSWLRRLR